MLSNKDNIERQKVSLNFNSIWKYILSCFFSVWGYRGSLYTQKYVIKTQNLHFNEPNVWGKLAVNKKHMHKTKYLFLHNFTKK